MNYRPRVDCERARLTGHRIGQFYSWYIYHENEQDMGKPVSSATYVDDVNAVRGISVLFPEKPTDLPRQDSVVIIDGLTKVRV